jgi:uncharacterized protein (DUF1778 family)
MTRSAMLWTRCTEAERLLVEEAASSRGVSISDVVRGAVIAHARELLEGQGQ